MVEHTEKQSTSPALATRKLGGKVNKLQFALFVYPALIAAAGLAVVAAAAIWIGPVWNLTVGVLLLLAIVAEWMVIRLPEGHTVTISFVVVLLALLIPGIDAPVKGAIQALEVILAGSLIGYGLLRRQSLLRILFYTGHHALSGALAGTIYVGVARAFPPLGTESVHIPALFGYLVGYSLFSPLIVGPYNRALVSPTVERLPRVEFLVAFLVAPLSLLTFYLFSVREFSLSSLLLVLLPLIGVLGAFRLYVNIDTTYAEVKVLYEISQRFVSAMTEEETVQNVARGISRGLARLVDYDACLVYGYDREDNEFVLINTEMGRHGPAIILPGDGVLGRIAVGVQGEVINDVSEVEGRSETEKVWGPRTALLVTPLLAGAEIVGLLVLVRYRNTFNAEHFRLVKILSNQAGIVLRNAQMYEQSQILAETDRKLGILNPTAFTQRAVRELGHAQVEGYPVAVIFSDIDDFRRINNTYGHQVGDRVLMEIATIFNQAIGEQGLVGRYGGEEFVALVPRAGEDRAVELAEAFRRLVEQHVFLSEDGESFRVTVSIGIAVFPRDAHDIQGLVKQADRAAYLAKRLGKNRVCVYEDRRELLGGHG